MLILVVDVVLRIMKERCDFFLKILNLILGAAGAGPSGTGHTSFSILRQL